MSDSPNTPSFLPPADLAKELSAPDSGSPGDESIRPSRLEDFIGQEELRANLRVFLNAARERGQAMDCLLYTSSPFFTTVRYAADKATGKIKAMEADWIVDHGPYSEFGDLLTLRGAQSVSYTHLDVYKRQVQEAEAFLAHEPVRCVPRQAKDAVADEADRAAGVGDASDDGFPVGEAGQVVEQGQQLAAVLVQLLADFGVVAFELLAHLLVHDVRTHACQHLGVMERLGDVVDAADLEPPRFLAGIVHVGNEDHGDVAQPGIPFDMRAEGIACLLYTSVPHAPGARKTSRIRKAFPVENAAPVRLSLIHI